jgi:hypothetical protein
LYLLPKTELVIVGCCILIWLSLSHPFVKFWWVEDRRWRQCVALALLTVGSYSLAHYIEPEKTQETRANSESHTSVSDKISSPQLIAASQISQVSGSATQTGILAPVKHSQRKALASSASTKYVQINTPQLAEGKPLEVTVHAQIAGEVHDFLLSPNLAIIQFDHMPITEKDDIEADAAIRRQQVNTRNALLSISRPPDLITSNLDAFQTAVYPNIAKRDVDGFVTGQSRIYLLTFIGWRDGNNAPGAYESCLWLQSTPSQEIGLQHAVWHQCR